MTLCAHTDETPSLLDPIGPWHLDGVLQLPDCSNKLNVTTNHDKANISIAHTLKIMMRVERGDDEYLDSKGNRKVSRTGHGLPFRQELPCD